MKTIAIYFILVSVLYSCKFEPSEEWKKERRIRVEKLRVKKSLNKVKKNKILSYHSLIDSSYHIPKNYYTYYGSYDFYRRPLIYPYSLISLDSRSHAGICDERHNKNVAYDFNENTIQLQHKSIGWLYFNNKALIAKSDSYNKPDKEYLLFDFKTQDFQEFITLNELKLAALEYNIDTSNKLISVEEYHEIFW